MPLVDLVMPKMGESIMEATILKWIKHKGDFVNQDEAVLEIATDKVDTEVPSTESGYLDEILYAANEVVPVGAVIARIKTTAREAERASSKPSPPTSQLIPDSEEISSYPIKKTPEDFQPGLDSLETTSFASNGKRNGENKFYSPLVITIASREGIPLSELDNLAGSGLEGRVTKRDILQYVADRKSIKANSSNPIQEFASSLSSKHDTLSYGRTSGFISEGAQEIIQMDRMRKLIADHMVKSKQTSPHVTSFTEADVTNLVNWREKIKKEFEAREGIKITYTPLFIEAIVRSIKKFPIINSSVEGDKIIIKKDIHIGMATALPTGNLIVPVIRNADQFNLVGLTKQVNQLAASARSNKLNPDDIQGGTFTLTNVGVFGSLMGTPIINQPQVAILAVGAIKKRPVVVETSFGDSIAIRHMMYLSLSYDHRIIDGSIGASFLSEVASSLEKFDPNSLF